jgi:hypothetical protein
VSEAVGLEPDPWELQVLEERRASLPLNGCRQAGQSTVAATLALAEAMLIPASMRAL